MRITGGFYKGRTVVCPPGVIRPAMDRMRESLFAILGDLTGTSFLDLYAGSGVVGIEAASRGADVVIVDLEDGVLPEAKDDARARAERIDYLMREAAVRTLLARCGAGPELLAALVREGALVRIEYRGAWFYARRFPPPARPRADG